MPPMGFEPTIYTLYLAATGTGKELLRILYIYIHTRIYKYIHVYSYCYASFIYIYIYIKASFASSVRVIILQPTRDIKQEVIEMYAVDWSYFIS